MAFYPFDVARYRKDTSHLSHIEHSIYRSLMDTYYEQLSPLECDDDKLMRRHSVRTEEEVAAYNAVIQEFFYVDGEFYRHSVCDEVIAQILEKSGKAKASAEKRWNKRKANVMRTHSESNADGVLDKGKEKGKEQLHTSKPSVSPCPVSQIIDLYKSIAIRLPIPRVIPDTTKADISARWRQDERFRTIEFWTEFFTYCENNQFLSGQVDGRDGKKPFRADLQWVVKASNFAKIINGNYHNA